MPSNLIPQASIDVLRTYANVILGSIGIPCSLYIPIEATYDTAEQKDAYSTPADYTWTPYACNCWIEWGPSVYRLKKLGLFTEENIPLVVWFPNKATNANGDEVDIDITIKSYFRIDAQHIPDSTIKTEEFELVNETIRGMHDAVVLQGFSAVPRRV